MSNLDALIKDLVIANRILAKEDVVDAYGHVTVRNPNNPKTFFLSRSLAPELIEKDDIMEFGMDGQPVDKNEKRSPYLERFIHAAIMEKYPDVNATVHAHAEDILPFGIATGTPLKPVIHSGSFIGPNVPVWDIADKFGDTNLLVTNVDQGRDLAKTMDGNPVALMRGHGFASCAALADRGGAGLGLPAAQRPRADARQAARRRHQVSQAGRDRRPQPRLQPLFERDLARLGVLGEQGRLRPHALAPGRRPRARARPQARP